MWLFTHYALSVLIFSILAVILDLEMNIFFGGWILLAIFYFLYYLSVQQKDIYQKQEDSDLNEAIQHDDVLKIETILRENRIDAIELSNALMTSIKKQNYQIIELLLKNWADIQQQQIFSSNYFMHKATRDIIELLLNYWADIHEVNWFWDWCIHLWVRGCQDGVMLDEDILIVLLKYWADINLKNKDHWRTPLHFASMHGNDKVIKLLLKHWANPNIGDNIWSGALHYVCWYNKFNPKALKSLLKGDADINLKNNAWLTPLMTASGFWHIDAVEILIKKWADIHLKSNENGTARKYAEVNQKRDIVELIKKFEK